MTASERFVRRQADGAAAGLAQVGRALAEVAAGRVVIVLDDSGEQARGHLVFAAQVATAELMAFTVRHTCGFVCVSIAESDADRLQLPAQFHTNQGSHGTAYAVTVDAREGVGTGISATDRAHTVRLLGDPASRPDQLSRPGHVVPVRARPGGVLGRAGNTEAAMDLARLAGLHPAGVLSEIVNDDGTVAGGEDLRDFADEHGLALVSIADLIAYRRVHEKQFEAVAQARIPTAHGQFRAVGYRSVFGDREHLALVRGELGDGEDVLVRVHTECLIGDAFGSLRCECHARLDDSLAAVAAEGRGVVLYLRGSDGSATGLVHKLQAYQRCDLGADPVDVAGDPGRADASHDPTVAEMLHELGVRSVRPTCGAEPRREPA